MQQFLYNKTKNNQDIIIYYFHSAASALKTFKTIGGVQWSRTFNHTIVGGSYKGQSIWAGGPLAGPWAGIYSYT